MSEAETLKINETNGKECEEKRGGEPFDCLVPC